MSPALVHGKAVRPDPLADEAGCDHYRGVPVGANDSTQQFELVVCPTPDGIRTIVQSSSLVSGWSVRQGVGSWDAAQRVLTARDTEFIESKPEPTWQFCLIDSLVLEKTEAGLTGSYVSEACEDRAQLQLVKVEPAGPAGSSGGSAGELPASPPPPPTPPPPEPEPAAAPKQTGCACEVAATGQPPLVLALLGLALAFAFRRRRGEAGPPIR